MLFLLLSFSRVLAKGRVRTVRRRGRAQDTGSLSAEQRVSHRRWLLVIAVVLLATVAVWAIVGVSSKTQGWINVRVRAHSCQCSVCAHVCTSKVCV